MKACDTCQHRTRAKICARAQDHGLGVVWCADITEPHSLELIPAHLEQLRHPSNRTSNVATEDYLRGVAQSEGRCVALALLNEWRKEARKETT